MLWHFGTQSFRVWGMAEKTGSSKLLNIRGGGFNISARGHYGPKIPY